MTKEQTMEYVNEQFKNFFKARDFKVRKEGTGIKATKDDVALTFYIVYDCCAKWYQEQEGVNSKLFVKLPYTHYEVARYWFKLDENPINVLEKLRTVYNDPEFLALLDWELPNIKKKLI